MENIKRIIKMKHEHVIVLPYDKKTMRVNIDANDSLNYFNDIINGESTHLKKIHIIAYNLNICREDMSYLLHFIISLSAICKENTPCVILHVKKNNVKEVNNLFENLKTVYKLTNRPFKIDSIKCFYIKSGEVGYYFDNVKYYRKTIKSRLGVK